MLSRRQGAIISMIAVCFVDSIMVWLGLEVELEFQIFRPMADTRVERKEISLCVIGFLADHNFCFLYLLPGTSHNLCFTSTFSLSSVFHCVHMYIQCLPCPFRLSEIQWAAFILLCAGCTTAQLNPS